MPNVDECRDRDELVRWPTRSLSGAGRSQLSLCVDRLSFRRQSDRFERVEKIRRVENRGETKSFHRSDFRSFELELLQMDSPR